MYRRRVRPVLGILGLCVCLSILRGLHGSCQAEMQAKLDAANERLTGNKHVDNPAPHASKMRITQASIWEVGNFVRCNFYCKHGRLR